MTHRDEDRVGVPGGESQRRQQPPSRRTAVAGMLGGLAGALGIVAADEPRAAAANGDPMRLGRLNFATATTALRNRRGGGTGLRVRALGRGSVGIKAKARSVGVDATALGAGTAVRGFCERGTGVEGRSFRQVGVDGLSGMYAGVRGGSRDSVGVLGESHFGSGVAGGSVSQDAPAVAGTAWGGATGVRGWSNTETDAPEPTSPNTGVHGVCDVTDGIGVLAQSAQGSALRVDGRAEFSRSGVLLVAADSASAQVTDISLSADSLALAVLAEHHAGLHVEAVVPDPIGSSFTVYLNATTDTDTRVNWFVVN